MDSDGKHVIGNWGNCPENCPKGCHIVNKRSEIVECAFPYLYPYSGSELVNKCIKQYPDNNESPLICYTKKNSTTNEAIIGRGDWGVCEQEYCPVLSTSSRFINFDFQS